MRVVWVLADETLRTGAMLAAWVTPLLAKNGHEVEILPLCTSEMPPDLFSVPVLEPPVRHGFGFKLQMNGVLRRCFGRYDRVIVDQTLDIELRAILAKEALSRRGQLITVAHIPLTHFLAARGENEVGRLRQMIGGLYPRIDRFIAVSDGVGADAVMRFGVDKTRLFVLKPPVPFERLAGESLIPPVEWPFADDGAVVVAALGYLEHLKGIEVLIQALKVLRDRGGAARLLVVGDGPARAGLIEQSRALGLDAAFPGWVPSVGSWLGAADIFVAPQYFDGSGWDLYSAMSVGLPVIATNAPVVTSEILAHGKIGRIISIGEPIALVDALENWIENPKLRDGAALLGKQRARAADCNRVESQWLEAICS